MITRFAMRGAWLMMGAAIAVALALVAAFAFSWGSTLLMAIVVAIAVPVGAVLIGLLPGIRELEVTAARTLLGIDDELIIPTDPTAAHRIRACAWTLFHAIAGLVTGFSVFGLIPGGAVIAFHGVTGVPNTPEIQPVVPWPGWVQVVAGILTLVGVAVIIWGLGLLSVRLVPRALGPTPADRLLLAEARLAKESQQVALARELHDGIGHALSVISIQAAGAQRIIASKPEQAQRALGNIEQAASGAQAELDHLLGLLRNPSATRNPEPGLDQLGELVETHRRLGQRVSVNRGDLPDDLPGLVSRTGYRVLAEGLGNAHAHAAPGEVSVDIADTDQVLHLRVASPYTGRRHRSTGGRGLAGLTERVGVLGGIVDAGPHGDSWILNVSIPHGRRK